MKCSNCNKAINDDEIRFCPSCGKEVEGNAGKANVGELPKKRKVSPSFILPLALILIGVAIWGVIAYINKPYYTSAFEKAGSHYANSEDTTLFVTQFSEDHESEYSSYEKDWGDDEDYPEVELSLVGGISNIDYKRSTNVYFEKGLIFENTGEVPVYLDDVEFAFKNIYGEEVTLEELEDMHEDFYFLYHEFLPERPIYPGETFSVNIDYFIDGTALEAVGREVGLLNEEHIEKVRAIFKINYYVKDKDLEMAQKGKVLKNNPHPLFEMKDVELEEAEDIILISGELVTDSKEKRIDPVYISLEFYDDRGELHYIQKGQTTYYGEAIDLAEDLEFDEIPNRIIFDTFAEEYVVKVNVIAGN